MPPLLLFLLLAAYSFASWITDFAVSSILLLATNALFALDTSTLIAWRSSCTASSSELSSSYIAVFSILFWRSSIICGKSSSSSIQFDSDDLLTSSSADFRLRRFKATPVGFPVFSSNFLEYSVSRSIYWRSSARGTTILSGTCLSSVGFKIRLESHL